MPARHIYKQPVISVNLLPQDPFMESFLGKFLTWALSIGRYIVIFTELIVILTFLSRFKLDRDLTDLNEAIVRQKAIIESYQEVEARFRDVQKKSNFLIQKEENAAILPVMTILEKNLPMDVKLDKLTIQQTGWSISAQALSAQGMKRAIDQIISQSPQSTVMVNSVKLDSLTHTIKFELRVAARMTAEASNPSSNSTQ